MKPNLFTTETEGRTTVSVSIPAAENHGRIDIVFEFRASEKTKVASLQEAIFDNCVTIVKNPKE